MLFNICVTMKENIKNVLAATDFSATGNNAVMAAIGICKRHNAVLHLLHVVEQKYVAGFAEFGGGTVVVNDDDQEARSQLYNMYERILKEHEIMMRIHMPTGIVHKEICLAAEELCADLLVTGSPGVWGIKEFFTGSTAFKIIKGTGIPVLTVPPTVSKSGYSSILFPVRPVQGILEKFRFMQPLLQPGVHVHIALLYSDTGNDELAMHEAEIAEILMRLRYLSVQCSVEVYVVADAAAKVLELCTKLAADLLVINATFDYGWEHFFTGPYTQQVVNHAAVQVLSFQCARNAPAALYTTKEQQPGIAYRH